MLTITIPDREFFDESQSRFIKMEGGTLDLEHSLAAVAKWEATHGVSFFTTTVKNVEESLDYIRCMTLTPDVDPNLYTRIDNTIMQKINEYIESKQTATTIRRLNRRGGAQETITAELIYYWMIATGVPSEYDKWHLNRLLTLIEVCNAKNAPSKNMAKKDIYAQNRALNEKRKAQYKTKG